MESILDLRKFYISNRIAFISLYKTRILLSLFSKSYSKSKILFLAIVISSFKKSMSSGPNFFLFDPDRFGVGRAILGSGVYWILKVLESAISGN